MSASLTDRQAAVLAFIREHLGAYGYPPTLREIGARMGIRSTNGVSDHLHRLAKKGVIALDGNGKSRGMRIIGSDGSLVPDVRSGMTLQAEIAVAGGDVYVNGRLIARLANPASAESLARNLRAALGTAAA